jgi:bifunctional non-homologous end joining protein LigD
LTFKLVGERLKGSWNLIRIRGEGKRENWLLIKARDEEARVERNGESWLDNETSSVKSGRSMEAIAEGKPTATGRKAIVRPREDATLQALLVEYPTVQLATLVDAPPEGDSWVHEIKFDGYRLQGFLSEGDVLLRTRNGQDWTAKFPAIQDAMKKLKAHNAVIDMEAVVLDNKGRSSFQALQAALGQNGSRNRIVAYVFDMLHLDGEKLLHRTLAERKEALASLMKKSRTGPSLQFSKHLTGSGRDVLENSCTLGLEGIVSKRADAPYRFGRDKTWLKTKCSQRQEFIIIGYSDPHRGDRALGALYLAYKKDAALKYAGKVGTGFTMDSARSLTKRLAPLAASKPVLPRSAMSGTGAGEWSSIHWVKPDVICEVDFTEWTEDGLVRHPSFQGLREDKESGEIVRERASPPPKESASKKESKAPAFHGITITHPDRVISERGEVTKGALAEYYAAVAPLMLAHIRRHPISLLRCPSGIGDSCFYQRNPGRGLGENVHPFKFRNNGKTFEYLYIEDETGLLELIQMGTIEIHPWGASVDAIDFPDRMIFDLDPAEDVPFDAVKLAARDLRGRLRRRNLESMVKCTGGKGLHVTVPLAGKNKWAEVKSFAASVVEEMVQAAPTAYVATMSKARRAGKIFIDYFRNDYTATAIGDYSIRALPGTPVATPLEWKELDGLRSASDFGIRDVLRRIGGKRAPAMPKGQRLK